MFVILETEGAEKSISCKTARGLPQRGLAVLQELRNECGVEKAEMAGSGLEETFAYLFANG